MSSTETETTETTDTASELDEALASVVDVLVELMRTGTRPDVLEAQRVLLQRLATQGDVFPSRVPAPLNITEVGGYLNLLQSLGQDGVQGAAIASALGVAGPPQQGVGLAGAVPVGFVEVANDRPAGPAQPSIPPTLTIRADFHAPFLTALATLHASGCALPLRAPRPELPASQPGATATSVDMDVVLSALGRSIEAFPGTVLVDPAADPLAIARLETPATSPFLLVARELDGGTAVPEASWVAKRASSTATVDDPPANARYLDVAPVLNAAGWYQPTPAAAPASLTDRGTLVRFTNVTGLVAGETTLGDDLRLLYTPAAIARSALASFTGFVWNGSEFAAA
jgi:hypothetical protein